MADLTMKQHDLEPGLHATLLDSSGNVISLVDAAAIRIRLANSRRVEIWERDANIDNALTGSISYDWQAGDTEIAGLFYAEFVVTWSGSRLQTYPPSGYLTVLIEPKL